MRKLLPFFALALLTLAGCKNSFDGTTAEQKIPANANVVLTLASPERTIAPGKLSEILASVAKTENWTFTFTRTDDTSVQDVIKECAASEKTVAFKLPTGTYDITAELSYTAADIPYTIEGKLTGVVVSNSPVNKTINIAFKKTTGVTGTLNYTFDFSGWSQVFKGKPVLSYELVKRGGAVADTVRKSVNLYTEPNDGSETTKYSTEYMLNESIGSGYWDISAYVTGYNADDPKLVYNIPINDNLVEIADGLTSTGSIEVPTPDTSKLYYVSCETDQQYNDNNGTFEFSRVSLLKAFEKAKSLKPSIKDVTFSLDKLKGESLELDASVLATGKTIHFQIASTGASFKITPEGCLETASGLTSVTFYTASDIASKKTVNMKQSFIENSNSNTPLDIILKNGVSLNCKLSEGSNGVRMNLHVYGIENYLKSSPVITLNSTAPCITTNTFYDAKGTDKTKDYMLSKKTTEDAGTTGGKTEYCIVPAGSGTLGTGTITDLSVTCAYGSEAPSLTKTGYKFTGTASYDYGDEITFTAKADNAASYVWSCFNTNTDQRETLSELDTGTCIVNIKKTKAINDDGVITMLVTAADSDGNATSYAVEFTVTGSTTTSRYILWDRSGYYAVSEDALTSDLSLSSQKSSLGYTGREDWDFGFDANKNLYTLESGNAAKTLNYYKNGLKGFSSTSSVDVSNTNISKIAITSNKVYASVGSSSGGSYLYEFEFPLGKDSTVTDISSSWTAPGEGVGIGNYDLCSLAADDTYLYIGCKDVSSDSLPLYVVIYKLSDLSTIAGIAKLDTQKLVNTADGVDTSLTTNITDMLAQNGKLYVLAAVYKKDGTGYCSDFNGNMYEIDPASITDTTVKDAIPASLLVKFNELDVTVNDGTTTKIACPYPSKFVAVMPGKLKIAIDGGISTDVTSPDGTTTEYTDEDYVVTYDIATKTADGVKFNNNNKMFDFNATASGFLKN